MFEAPAQVLRYGTFCSGVEGVSVAWEPLGCFEPVFFSEIDAFASAVLAHRWPEISNLGDLTALDLSSWRGRVDVAWGSTPCQAFSFAGLRRGMADKRGSLTLAFVERVEEIDPTYVVWENVKGVLSDKSNAFGCLLGALAGEDGPLLPPGGKWSHAGYVLGPKRTIAWRLFDAQHGGVPQRRERVFLVGSARGGADPRDILFEREGLRRDTAPRRQQGAAVAALTARGVGTCGADDNQAQAGHLIPTAFGGNDTRGPIDVAPALNAHGGPVGRLDFESEIFLVSTRPGVADTVTSRYGQSGGAGAGKDSTVHNVVVCATGDVTHALKAEAEAEAEGADASEDGTGRGNPIIAFSSKDYGADAVADIAPTLRAVGHTGSHPNAGGQMAVAYSIMPQNSGKDYKAREVDVVQPLMAAGQVGGNQGGDYLVEAVGLALRGRETGSQIEVGDEVANALRGASGGGSRALALIVAWADVIQARVRRLTPRECERLQGLPDDHTRIPWRGRPAELCPDGPRYKTIGNGLAITDVRWLGMRLATAHTRHLRTLELAA